MKISKCFIFLLIITALVSCKSTPARTKSERKTILYTLTNRGYSSAQMSLNQINATIINIAQLCVDGMGFTYLKSGEISIFSDSTIGSDRYNSLSESRKMDMVRNVYKINEEGKIYFIPPKIDGLKISTVINSNKSGTVYNELLTVSIKRNLKPGATGKIYLTGNIKIDEEIGTGSGIFTITTNK